MSHVIFLNFNSLLPYLNCVVPTLQAAGRLLPPLIPFLCLVHRDERCFPSKNGQDKGVRCVWRLISTEDMRKPGTVCEKFSWSCWRDQLFPSGEYCVNRINISNSNLKIAQNKLRGVLGVCLSIRRWLNISMFSFWLWFP